MNRGRHAADDGSFNRSAGMAAGRGAALLALAVLLGVVLLSATDNGPTGVSAGPSATEPTDGSPDQTLSTIEDLPTTTTTVVVARPPAEVKVLTLNATDVRGAASRANDVVKKAGFNVLAPTDGTRGAVTTVYFTPTYEAEAAAVAGALGVMTTSVQPVGVPPPIADLRGANVVVLVGADLAARLPAPAAPASSPSTTKVTSTTKVAGGPTSTSTSTAAAASTTTSGG
ncbi:MAG: LytR C-terminal domain-containing protein [Acidimicrobiales bacterium]